MLIDWPAGHWSHPPPSRRRGCVQRREGGWGLAAGHPGACFPLLLLACQNACTTPALVHLLPGVCLCAQAWDQHWDWFQQLPASAHMFSSNATESYRAEGSFPWDKGHALSAI